MSPTLLASLLAFASPDAVTVERDVREILDDDRYAFCDEDRSFVPVGVEFAWCPLVGRANPQCPGFGDHCETPVATTYTGGGDDTVPTSVRPRRNRRGVFNDGAGGTEPATAPQVAVTPTLTAFSQLLLFGIAILFALVVLRAIIGGRGEDDEESTTVDGEAEAPPALGEADVQRRQIETDVARLLERARRNAGEGEYRRAIDDVYAALLRRLDGDGLIEIHHARTNGDYLRALREHPDLRREVRVILRDVERVQFGDAEPDEPLFRRVLDQVKPLVSRQLGGLLLAFGLGLGLSGCALGDEHEGLAGLSTDPLGGRAAVQLLRRHDVPVHHRTRTIEQLRQSDGLLLLHGDVSPTPEEWDILLDWTREGGILVVATGNDDLPSELGLAVADAWTWSEDRSDLAFAGGYRYSYEDFSLRSPRLGHLERTGTHATIVDMIVRPDDTQDGEVEVLYDEYGYPYEEPVPTGELYAARVDLGEGHALVFADEMLFTNAAMAVGDDARFVVELLSQYERDIEVIDAWTGSGSQSPVESIANSHLTPLVLQLLAFMTLLYLWRGVAFARLKDPPPRGRRAFVDHVHALALQYAKARASRHVLSAYASWVLERLRNRVAPGSDRTLHGLARAVAARTGRDEASVMRILVEAHTMRESAAHASGVYTARRRDLDLMRELSALLAESKRSRGKR